MKVCSFNAFISAISYDDAFATDSDFYYYFDGIEIMYQLGSFQNDYNEYIYKKFIHLCIKPFVE